VDVDIDLIDYDLFQKRFAQSLFDILYLLRRLIIQGVSFSHGLPTLYQ